MGQGEFRLMPDVLGLREDEGSFQPTNKAVGNGVLCERFWECHDNDDGDESSNYKLVCGRGGPRAPVWILRS